MSDNNLSNGKRLIDHITQTDIKLVNKILVKEYLPQIKKLIKKAKNNKQQEIIEKKYKEIKRITVLIDDYNYSTVDF